MPDPTQNPEATEPEDAPEPDDLTGAPLDPDYLERLANERLSAEVG
jgi:hypothetical protein